MEKMGKITYVDLCIYLSKLYKVNSFSLHVNDSEGNSLLKKEIPFDSQNKCFCYVKKCQEVQVGYSLNGIIKTFKLETVLTHFNIIKEISRIEGISKKCMTIVDKNLNELKLDNYSELQIQDIGILQVKINSFFKYKDERNMKIGKGNSKNMKNERDKRTKSKKSNKKYPQQTYVAKNICEKDNINSNINSNNGSTQNTHTSQGQFLKAEKLNQEYQELENKNCSVIPTGSFTILYQKQIKTMNEKLQISVDLFLKILSSIFEISPTNKLILRDSQGNKIIKSTLLFHIVQKGNLELVNYGNSIDIHYKYKESNYIMKCYEKKKIINLIKKFYKLLKVTNVQVSLILKDIDGKILNHNSNLEIKDIPKSEVILLVIAKKTEEMKKEEANKKALKLNLKKEIEKKKNYLEENFICPICLELLVHKEKGDPFVARDGKSYHKECILAYFQKSDISPFTRERLSGKELSLNRDLKTVILNCIDDINALQKKFKSIKI